MDTNDNAIEKTEQVIEALAYAEANNLEINSNVDVKKILVALNPEHSSDEDVEEFKKLLLASSKLMDLDSEHKKNLN